MLSFELLLFCGVLVFYLFDSSMLLYLNELVFIRSSKNWDFACPGNCWLLLGKRLYIPNPLRPDVAIFRVYWIDLNQRTCKVEQSLDAYFSALVPLRHMIVMLLILLLALLPLVLIIFGSGAQLLWVYGAVYLNILLILYYVYRHKKTLKISNRKYLEWSFECLVCAPFALNLLRKITLHRSLFGDPIEFADKSFDQKKFDVLVDIVSKRIDQMLDFEDIDHPCYVSLQSYKMKIIGMKK